MVIYMDDLENRSRLRSISNKSICLSYQLSIIYCVSCCSFSFDSWYTDYIIFAIVRSIKSARLADLHDCQVGDTGT